MRTSPTPKAETFTFRLDPALKAGLARCAAAQDVQPAELMRSLVRNHLLERERHAFEIEARRQSLAVAARAEDPACDDAQFMRELEAGSDADKAFGEWKA